jgi:hypothetical protein
MSRWITGLVPNWKVLGDWFDVCKCNIPCPCTFAQAPSYGDCQGVLAYHIKNGHYGETSLNGLNVLMVGGFKGNAWAGEIKEAKMAFFFDERGNEKQQEAMHIEDTCKD